MQRQTPCAKLFGSIGNQSQTLNEYYEIDNTEGYATLTAHIIAPTGGEVTFTGTVDGTNWDTFTMRSITDDLITSSTDDHSDFIGSISGLRKIRFVTSTGGSAVGTTKGMLLREVSVIENIEFGWAPHRFGYFPVHRDASYTTAQTATDIWTPATGKKFVVTDLSIVVGGNTDGTLTVFDETDTTGNRLFKGNIEVATNRQFIFQQALKTPFISSAANNDVKVTTTAAMTVDMNLHGYEI